MAPCARRRRQQRFPALVLGVELVYRLCLRQWHGMRLDRCSVLNILWELSRVGPAPGLIWVQVLYTNEEEEVEHSGKRGCKSCGKVWKRHFTFTCMYWLMLTLGRKVSMVKWSNCINVWSLVFKSCLSSMRSIQEENSIASTYWCIYYIFPSRHICITIVNWNWR